MCQTVRLGPKLSVSKTLILFCFFFTKSEVNGGVLEAEKYLHSDPNSRHLAAYFFHIGSEYTDEANEVPGKGPDILDKELSSSFQ